MTEFFKAFDNFKWNAPKKYYIYVQGKKLIETSETHKEGAIEIDIQTYFKIKDNGVDRYLYKDGKLVYHVKKNTVKFPEIYPSTDTGFNLVNGNPYWIKEKANKEEKQYQWKTVK
jgi:hypothetical protein